MRAVSLLPSATEILSAVGVDPVGISHSCDHPPDVTDRPRVTSTIIDHEGRSSREIDEQMQSVDGAVYDIDADRLEALDPDIIVTQATCDVCAVESSAVFETVAARDLDATVLTLDPHSFEEVLADVRRVGDAVDRVENAEQLIEAARDRIERVRSRAEDADRPRTAVLDWTDPPIRAGHWVRDLVGIAGGDASFQPDGPSEPVRWSDLRAYDPERLVVAPCGFGPDRAAEAVAELAARPGWADLSAVRSGHVYAADGNALFNRPGPRLVASLEVLADCLHPDHDHAVEGAWRRRIEHPTETTVS